MATKKGQAPKAANAVKRGRPKTGGRQKGTRNKATIWKEIYKQAGGKDFLKQMVAVRNTAKKLFFDTKNQDLQAVGERIAESGNPMEATVYRMVSDLIRNPDALQISVFFEKIFGVPMEYLKGIFISQAALEELKEEIKKVKLDEGVTYDKLMRFVLLHTDVVLLDDGVAKRFEVIVNTVKDLLREKYNTVMREKELELKLAIARNVAFSAPDVQNLLDFMLEGMSLHMAEHPDVFERIMDHFNAKVESSNLMDKVETGKLLEMPDKDKE